MIVAKELPASGEVVLVKINKIMPHGAYCSLIEYNVDAYLPISEVASGWIKNIHEFIKEGQREVAKVVFIDPSKRALDVSLKKITSKQKKDKIGEYNSEKRAEQLFSKALSKLSGAELADIKSRLSQKFQTYADVINAAYENHDLLKGTMSTEAANLLVEIAKKNIKPKSYTVAYRFEVKALNGKGNINTLKEAFGLVQKAGVSVLYEGAPHYKFTATNKSYPEAEDMIKKSNSILSQFSGKLSVAEKGKVQ